jgi:hypothetical protein
MTEIIGGWPFLGTQELWILLGILLAVAGRHSLLAWMRRRRQPLSTEAWPNEPVVHVTRDEEPQVTRR